MHNRSRRTVSALCLRFLDRFSRLLIAPILITALSAGHLEGDDALALLSLVGARCAIPALRIEGGRHCRPTHRRDRTSGTEPAVH